MQCHNYELDSYTLLRKLSIDNDWPALTGREFQVLSCLAWHRNSKYFQCNPSYKRLAEEMKCSRSSVQSAANGLRQKGFIQVTKRYNEYDGHNTSMQFWIMIDINTIHEAMKDDEALEFIEKAQKIDVIACYKKHFDK